MTDIILHHYPTSPFAEKIRLILGAKKLSWQSVLIPQIMPKPDVVALTGGYRRTPILQLGANIICDTALIARKLNALSANGELYPPQHLMNAQAIATWADSILFQSAVPLAFLPEVLAKAFAGREAEMQAFVADRVAMRKDSPAPRLPLVDAKSAFTLSLKNLESQLGQSNKFLLGDSPCIADFSTYHPLWFIATKPVVGYIFNAYPNIRRWMATMKAFGHGSNTQISGADAITIAKNATPQFEGSGSAIPDLNPGDCIMVQPTDYGIDPVNGTLMYCNEYEVVLKRVDERAGELAVHFPRSNYTVSKVETAGKNYIS